MVVFSIDFIILKLNNFLFINKVLIIMDVNGVYFLYIWIIGYWIIIIIIVFKVSIYENSFILFLNICVFVKYWDIVVVKCEKL